MTTRSLLRDAAARFDRAPQLLSRPLTPALFTRGAGWMGAQLTALDPGHPPQRSLHRRFGAWGLFKYGCSAAAAAVFLPAAILHPYLVPLPILAFYAVEVHFIFLFPLLLDGVASPLRTSIRATHRVGFGRALLRVLHLAAYMLSGLLIPRRPLRRWHIGCLAVLTWYCDEVRGRM